MSGSTDRFGASAVRVREVRSRADRRAYLGLVREPYRDNPHWVHPDVRILKGLLRGRTLLAERSEWHALIAEEDGEAVGGLAAVLHRSLEEELRQKVRPIGLFEAPP